MITEIYFESTSPKGTKGIPISWDISGAELPTVNKPDGTLALFGCGCSTFKKVGNSVVGTYNWELTDTTEKVFRVFLDDGKPLYIKNNTGDDIPNNAGKRHIKLKFKLNVQS